MSALLSLEEVCAILGRGRRQVVRYIRRGELIPTSGKPVKGGAIGRGRALGQLSYRFSREAVEEFQAGGPRL